ncbi:hypothetical protein Plec18167_003980 [Paecilomyces lecythidis]|uniref:AB hydrolase-1 domain-containing protein n=1 Tax=Paecilomyces lecythidis TaxID=3004212 RepID=A0ABR3XVD3_9EURO
MNVVYIAAALLLGSAAAKTCINQTIPVNVTARIGLFDESVIPQNGIETVTFTQNLTRRGVNFTDTVLLGYETISGTYNISTQFCSPNKPSRDDDKKLVQVLTHGIAFDKTYWDLAFDAYNYSYVDVATDDYGFYTLSYDRLGIGQSSHGPPLEVQLRLEVEALHALTSMLHEGSFPGVDEEFECIVHVGHSFGSLQTLLLTALYPNISDAVVLTGFSSNATYLDIWTSGCDFQSAKDNQPSRLGSYLWGVTLESVAAQTPFEDLFAGINIETARESYNYPPGYLVPGNRNSLQFGFLTGGYFDPSILPYADNIKQPTTAGELLTLRSAPAESTFSGPVMVLTGEFDVPFCGGNCLNTGDPRVAAIPDTVREVFTNVDDDDFFSYIQPNTGHGINMHYNSTGAYRVIGEWLRSMGSR